MDLHVFWSTLHEPGMEHLHLTDASGEVVGTGTVLGVAGKAFHLVYEVRAASDWRVRSCAVSVEGASSQVLYLASDGMGHWADAAGQRLPTLDGCLDVDIMVTPFTNTLPIRRLALASGKSAEITVAYIGVPDLAVRPARQRYTHLTQTADGGAYRYEGLDTGFRADLVVDGAGLVLDYPGIWGRLG
jgi:hypothetical protein